MRILNELLIFMKLSIKVLDVLQSGENTQHQLLFCFKKYSNSLQKPQIKVESKARIKNLI